VEEIWCCLTKVLGPESFARYVKLCIPGVEVVPMIDGYLGIGVILIVNAPGARYVICLDVVMVPLSVEGSDRGAFCVIDVSNSKIVGELNFFFWSEGSCFWYAHIRLRLIT
jgi:hypothetical protein